MALKSRLGFPSARFSDMALPFLFCFGLGYSPLVLAERLLVEGWRVGGTTRSADKAAALRARGIKAVLLDRGRPFDDPAAVLARATHLLSAVPPDAEGDPVLDHHASDLAELSGLRWAG